MWVEVFEYSSWPCQQATVASCRENHCVQLWHLLVHLQPHGSQAWQVNSTVLPVGRKGTDQQGSQLSVQQYNSIYYFQDIVQQKNINMRANQQHMRGGGDATGQCHQMDHRMLLPTGRKLVPYWEKTCVVDKPLKESSDWRALNSHFYQVFTERSHVSIAITSFSSIKFKCCSPNYKQSLKKKSPSLYLSMELVFVMNGNFQEV